MAPGAPRARLKGNQTAQARYLFVLIGALIGIGLGILARNVNGWIVFCLAGVALVTLAAFGSRWVFGLERHSDEEPSLDRHAASEQSAWAQAQSAGTIEQLGHAIAQNKAAIEQLALATGALSAQAQAQNEATLEQLELATAQNEATLEQLALAMAQNRAAIEQLALATDAVSAQAEAPSKTTLGQLLAELHEKGILTDAEFVVFAELHEHGILTDAEFEQVQRGAVLEELDEIGTDAEFEHPSDELLKELDAIGNGDLYSLGIDFGDEPDYETTSSHDDAEAEQVEDE